MTYIMSLLLVGFMASLVAVASNPSPYFAALGVVMAAGMGCGAMVSLGGAFLSLVLFLIYLGGMLVVFVYTCALAAVPFPETLGSWGVLLCGLLYAAAVGLIALVYCGGWSEHSWAPADEVLELSLSRGDVSGVVGIYAMGAGLLVGATWVLFLTLLVVLELTRGRSRGALRSPK